jgi:DNA-binding LytR/AlgR family response regulator
MAQKALQIRAFVIEFNHRKREEARLLKIRIEICEEGEEELILRCHSRDGRIGRIEDALERIVRGSREITLYSGGTEFYIPISEILFFESSEGKVYAHAKDRTYTAPHKLFELENILPTSFVRISKSAIANVRAISSITRELVGNGTITFSGCVKKAYFSRSYYKILRDRIDEIRLS